MSDYNAEDVRNIALVGPAGSGKTTLVEALLAATGVIPAPGSVARGTTVCDYDPMEKEYRHSLDIGITSFNAHGKHVNLLDTPGFPDFIGRSVSVLTAVETAAVVINAQAGIERMTQRMMKVAEDRQLCRIIIVNKIDAEGLDLEGLTLQIRDTFGPECLPINLPANGGKKVVDCFFLPSGTADFSSVEEAHGRIIDQVVEVDEALMEIYLEQGEDLQPEQLHDPFEKASRLSSRLQEPHGEIDADEVLGEVADGDVVHAGFGDDPQTVQGDAARGLQTGAARDQAHGLTQGIGGEVVEEQMGSAGRQGLFDLGEGFDLDLHQQTASQGTGGVEGGGDGARRQDMVFLDEDGIMQSQAVVVTTATAHGVFLGQPQARDGLAGVEEAHRQIGDGKSIPAGAGGGAREGLEEVHGGALSGEKGAGGALHPAQAIAGANLITIGYQPVDSDAAVELTEGLFEPGPATDDRLLTGDKFHPRSLVRRQEGGGAIPATEILGQGGANLVGYDAGVQPLQRPWRTQGQGR